MAGKKVAAVKKDGELPDGWVSNLVDGDAIVHNTKGDDVFRCHPDDVLTLIAEYTA